MAVNVLGNVICDFMFVREGGEKVCLPQWTVFTDCSAAPAAQTITLCPLFPNCYVLMCICVWGGVSCLGQMSQESGLPAVLQTSAHPARLHLKPSTSGSSIMWVVAITCSWQQDHSGQNTTVQIHYYMQLF